MSEKSFWENLGRSFGYGVRKVKRVGERLSDEAEGLLDVKEAREQLEGLYRAIGLKVCDALGENPRAIDVDEELRELIQKVREVRAEVARLEAETEAKVETEAGTKAEKEAGEETRKRERQDGGTETTGKRESDRGEPSGQEPKDD